MTTTTKGAPMIDAATLRSALDAVKPEARYAKDPVTIAQRTGWLTFTTGSDVRLALDVRCPGTRKQATVTVELNRLRSAIATMRGPITLNIEDGKRLEVVTEAGSSFRLLGNPKKITPAPALGDKVLAHLTDEQVDEISRVRFAASGDTYRPVLTCISIDDGHAIATDSYRLVVLDLEERTKTKVLIPARSFDYMPEGGVEILAGDGGAIGWKSGPLTVTSIRQPHEFPNWRSLIPDEELASTVTLPRLEVAAALRRIKPFAGEVEPVILTAKGDDKIELGLSNATEYVPAEFAGVTWPKIGLNIEFLIEGVEACFDDDITIEANDGLKPIVIDEGDFVYVLMPVRVS